jgi:uncharacterized protein involved in exopolysaccharide biosynthesis
MRAYVETALRLRWRLLLCALALFGMAMGALYFAKQGYTSDAMIWVEQPLYLKDQFTTNPYISAAESQANIFNELLSTRQFTLSIAQAAGLDLADDARESIALDDIRRNLRVDSAGPHLIRMSYTSNSSEYARVIIEKSIERFIAEMDTNRTRQADVALELYQQQRDNYEQQVKQSREALDNYLQNNPDAMTAGAPASPVLVELQMQYNIDRERYDEAVSKIDDIMSQSQAATEATTQFFRVVDNPTDPRPSSWSGRDYVKNGGVAFALALFAVVGLILVGTWANTLIYSPADVEGIARLTGHVDDIAGTGLTVATIPYLRVLKQQKGSTSASNKPQRESRHQALSGTTAAAPGTEAGLGAVAGMAGVVSPDLSNINQKLTTRNVS